MLFLNFTEPWAKDLNMADEWLTGSQRKGWVDVQIIGHEDFERQYAELINEPQESLSLLSTLTYDDEPKTSDYELRKWVEHRAIIFRTADRLFQMTEMGADLGLPKAGRVAFNFEDEDNGRLFNQLTGGKAGVSFGWRNRGPVLAPQGAVDRPGSWGRRVLSWVTDRIWTQP